MRALGAHEIRILGCFWSQAESIRQAFVPMLVWALVNDIKGHNSGRRFPARAEVDVDLSRFLLCDDLHVIPILVLIIRGFVREDGVNGHTFTQALPYSFHLQSASGSL